MSSEENKLISILQDPQRSPNNFEVKYEVFADYYRQELAYLGKRIRELEAQPLHKFPSYPPQQSREKILAGDPEAIERASNTKSRKIKECQEEVVEKSAWVLAHQQQHEEIYQKFKGYFQEKIVALGLSHPLIFFDDEALRIDIGYGRVEFEALFLDFIAPGGLLQRELHPDIGFFDEVMVDELFHLDYLHPDYTSRLRKETESILQEYEVFAQSQNFTRIRPILPPNPAESNIVETYLEHHSGFVLGEVHEDKAPKKFLIENMHKFKEQGVTTLYMEHLLSERHQVLLDEYCASSEFMPMPKELELYLAHLDFQRNLPADASFTAVVKAAKAQKIRIVAIDTEATYVLGIVRRQSDLHDINASRNRYKAMNMAVAKHVREQGGGKYIIFVGNAHVSTFCDVLGVSELLNVPNIFIKDTDENLVQNDIEINAKYESGKNSQICFDVLYQRSLEPVSAEIAVQAEPSPSSRLHESSSANNRNPLTPALKTHGVFKRSMIEGVSRDLKIEETVHGNNKGKNICSIQ